MLIDLDVEWVEEDAGLRIVFPTDFLATHARYGAAFGSLLRPQPPQGLATEAEFEVPGSRYACVMNDTQTAGLTLLTESKYGFSCRNGTLGVTLLKSTRVTGEDNWHARVAPRSLRRDPDPTP